MPLSYQGKLIQDFWLEFKDGKVIDYGAKKEQDVLKNLVEFDEGSCYLGEVALISYDSPIKILEFYSTIPYLMRMHPAIWHWETLIL